MVTRPCCPSEVPRHLTCSSTFVPRASGATPKPRLSWFMAPVVKCAIVPRLASPRLASPRLLYVYVVPLPLRRYAPHPSAFSFSSSFFFFFFFFGFWIVAVVLFSLFLLLLLVFSFFFLSPAFLFQTCHGVLYYTQDMHFMSKHTL